MAGTRKISGQMKQLLRPGGDQVFELLLASLALLSLGIVAVMVGKMIIDARQSIEMFGLRFFTGTQWDNTPPDEEYGVLPFVFGTLTTSAIAVLIGVPVSIGIAVYLAELAPTWVREPLSFVVELLAAVPSVIYGLWAMGTLRPVMTEYIEPALIRMFGWTPLFEGTPRGLDKLTAGVILGIMIIPTIASLSKEALRAVPDSQREAAMSLGATRYETTRMAVLSYARSGIFGACILGLGRAIGETMAVAMTIGNSNHISWSLLDPGQTMASLIANTWSDAEGVQLSALIEVGFVLFVVALLINVGARLVIRRFMKKVPSTGAGL